LENRGNQISNLWKDGFCCFSDIGPAFARLLCRFEEAEPPGKLAIVFAFAFARGAALKKKTEVRRIDRQRFITTVA
jgi:hypothetical protein